MHGLQQLFSSDLPIPLWHLVLYVGLVSYFMFQRWFKLSFLASFILVLYWVHYAFRPDLVGITSEAHLARAIYYVLGFALILLSIFALTFLEVDANSLLDKREKELTLLKAQVKNAEKTATALQAQLQQDQTEDSNNKKKREKKLSTKIETLEEQLQQAEGLLKARDTEIAALQMNAAEAQKNASAVEALLDMYQNQESSSKKKLEEELKAKIETLELQLRQRENLLEQRNAEFSALQSRAYEAEADAAALKTQLQDSFAGDSTAGLEGELDAQIDQLKTELTATQALLKERSAEAAEFWAKASEAEKQAAALKADLDRRQSQESVSKKKLEEKFNTRISKLENQLKQGEKQLEKRTAEVAELRAKAAEAEKRAIALNAQLAKERAQESAAKTELGTELNARISQLEDQVRERDSLLDSRNREIQELEATASQAELDASDLREQLNKNKSEVSAASSQLQQELSARIDKLEDELKDRARLLEERNAEITQLEAKAAAAEKNAITLLARIEEDQHTASTATSKLERDLNAKIAALELKLKQDETLLDNRATEINALKDKVSAAEKDALAYAAQFEEEKAKASAAETKLKGELSATISQLRDQLKEHQASLKEREAEVSQLKTKAAQAEKNASSVKSQLEKDNAQVSAAKKATDELRAKVTTLEGRLREGETLLKARNSEVATLQAKVSQTEKTAAAFKAQLEKEKTQVSSDNQKLETELREKIGKLEAQLQESQSALEKRQSENAESKANAYEGSKGATALKQPVAANRPSLQAQAADDKNASEDDVRRKLHQFQYAVKYLEDEIKEKDRLLSLMAKKQAQAQTSTKSPVDEDLKKKVHQLEQTVKYLENQSKEKDGLLSLMAKRNRELADLKSKAEERLEALEGGLEGNQGSKSSEPDITSER